MSVPLIVLVAASAPWLAAAEGANVAPATGEHRTTDMQAEVLVYGAALPGCIAAVAASRSGAQRVVLASPYEHVGGMTTGGLQHADPGNESTVAGITGEFFDRVMARYPSKPRPEPHSEFGYSCRAGRCVEVARSGGNSSLDPHCADVCAPLASDEWLAVTFLSSLSNDNTTLTVSLPEGQASSFIKKSEKPAHSLPAAQAKPVKQGQVLRLAAPAVQIDETYYLIKLRPSALGRLVANTATELWPHWQAADPSAPKLKPGAPPGWLYEGHVAEEVLEEMLAEANVTVIRGLGGLVRATTQPSDPTVLTSVTAETGEVLFARYWIDASYEGDLAAVAGAEIVFGREANTTYNEPGAGRQPASITYDIDPFWPDGSVIPHVSNAPLVPVGQADKRVQVYTFRLCLTDSPGHRIPIWRPKDYDPREWEFWRRLYNNGSRAPANLRAAGLGCLGPIPNNYSDCGIRQCVKCDMLGMKHATDMLNGAWGYPNGTLAERKAIRQKHIHYITGLLWFWASDPAAGPALRAEMASIGHCTDEYGPPQTYTSDPPHWPYQLYVREASRIVGDFVWTELDPPPSLLARTIGLGAYTFDCHWCSLYVLNSSTTGTPARIAAEGRVNQGRNGKRTGGVLQTPFKIPYDALLPKRSELTNVLVPTACSSSHVRINAVRMEPVWGIQGHAAGAAVAMALATHGAVQDVDVRQLQELLRQQKQKLDP
eukprot:SAG31_NODE_2224_length_6150_cov_5.071724_2_plen_713_part_00